MSGFLPTRARWIRMDTVQMGIHIRYAWDRWTQSLWRWVDHPACLCPLSVWVWLMKGPPTECPPPAELARGQMVVQLQREREGG